MKKFTFALLLLIGAISAASAKDTFLHDASVLPKAAQTTIANNFNAQVSLVKIDKEFGRVSEFEVILTDGTEISFDRDGNWENIETAATKAVPAAFIPKTISNFVANKHAGTKIVSIDKERNGYEVELSNGIDIKFNRAGEFQRYDR